MFLPAVTPGGEKKINQKFSRGRPSLTDMKKYQNNERSNPPPPPPQSRREAIRDWRGNQSPQPKPKTKAFRTTCRTLPAFRPTPDKSRGTRLRELGPLPAPCMLMSKIASKSTTLATSTPSCGRHKSSPCPTQPRTQKKGRSPSITPRTSSSRYPPLLVFLLPLERGGMFFCRLSTLDYGTHTSLDLVLKEEEPTAGRTKTKPREKLNKTAA